MKINSLIALLFLSSTSWGQTKFKMVQLDCPKEAIYAFSQIEPSIAIDPNNPKIMVAGSVLSDYYYSANGGKTWKSYTLKSKYGVYGDPVVMFDNFGKVYYFHLASYQETTHLDRIICQKTTKKCSKKKSLSSFDEGTFPEPNGSKVQDKQWTALNPGNNEIYMTWTQFDAYDSENPMDSSIIVFSKSVDQGASWTTPKRISKFGGDCRDNDNTVEGAVPAVGPKGEIYVTWTGPRGLVFQKSLDGGETWMEEEQMIEKHYGGWTLDIEGIYRANGLPILDCDLSSGPNSGTIYLNWCDQRNGAEDTDVWLMKSTDEGQTWSKPIKVNQDTDKKQQFFTWMTVDQSTGYLYFVYYDRRNQTGIETDVYMSYSKDGGTTFTDVQLNEAPFVPDAEVFFGDYLNIDAVNGVIRPIWPRMDNQMISLWVSLINQSDLN